MSNFRICIVILAVICLPLGAPAPSHAQSGASMPLKTLNPPPSSLQRRLAEHRQRQAELAAQRPLRQKSRLRRLTGDGQAAGATNGSTPAAVTAGDSPLNSGVVARAAMAAAAYAAMVAALTGDFTPLAAVSGADGSSGSSNGGGTSISTSTSTSSGTN